MHAFRLAMMNIRLVMRTKTALFFTFLFPIIFLFVYAGIFAHGRPEAVAYFFGPVLTLNIMGSGFWGLGVQSVAQRERGSLRRYRLAPIGAGSIVVSSFLANYILQLPAALLLLLCAMFIFHMPLHVGLLTLWAMFTVGNFAFAGFGLTIASIANTMQEAQVYNNVIWFALLFLSGVTVPLPMLPHVVQSAAAFLPATYLVVAFQAIMLEGQALVQHWQEMLVLLVSGFFGLLFAWKLFRWEKDEKISRRTQATALLFVAPFIVMGVWMTWNGRLKSAWSSSFSFFGTSGSESRPATKAVVGESIVDFEGPTAENDLIKNWTLSTAGGIKGQSVGEIALVSPGAEGSGHAFELSGTLGPDKDGNVQSVTGRLVIKAPATLKDAHSVVFEARGDAHLYHLTFYPPGVKEDAAPAISLIPTKDWQEVRIPVRWLETDTGASEMPATWTLEITVSGQPGSFSLDLDQLKYQ
jgi:ABC-2 type transport system permease protein